MPWIAFIRKTAICWRSVGFVEPYEPPPTPAVIPWRTRI